MYNVCTYNVKNNFVIYLSVCNQDLSYYNLVINNVE